MKPMHLLSLGIGRIFQASSFSLGRKRSEVNQPMMTREYFNFTISPCHIVWPYYYYYHLRQPGEDGMPQCIRVRYPRLC